MKTIQLKLSEDDYSHLLIESNENTGAKAITKAIEERAKYKKLYQDMVEQFEEMNEHAKQLEYVIGNKILSDRAFNGFLKNHGKFGTL